ncbi:putative Embryonic protein UVS.2 [Hypsibius exemplaris]|uniref:Metalloendopeptidase n=1 Tax=Hypsibius exemplaris TaxID=2072580 RepID=A0A1W0WQE0_HYPEX|nr:putative Embryonic protein UVS.2 [Hypsibius exemplaris]
MGLERDGSPESNDMMAKNGIADDAYRWPKDANNSTVSIPYVISPAFRFFHEQARGDRDDYVDINYANIVANDTVQFAKVSNSVTFGQEYDFESVMHYEKYSFAIDKTVWTIRPKDDSKIIGQRLTLSPTDISKINLMYNCENINPDNEPAATSTPTTMAKISKLAAVANSNNGGTVTSDLPVPEYFCYFYNNLRYSCKTKCEASGGETVLKYFTSTSRGNFRGVKQFYDMDCKADLQLSSEKRWEIGSNSLVPVIWSTNVEVEILATCAFYKSMDFKCSGVTDCQKSNNENRCGSTELWSGSYSGSPNESPLGPLPHYHIFFFIIIMVVYLQLHPLNAPTMLNASGVI